MMKAINRGFTLIEVMVVVVIIAVLSSIAFPSYTQYVLRAKRAEAKNRLLQVAQLQERYFTQNNGYALDIAPLLGLPALTTVYSDSSNAASDFQIGLKAGATADQYTLQAIPVGANAAKHAKCGYLQLAHTGQKSIDTSVTGGTGTVAECWNK